MFEEMDALPGGVFAVHHEGVGVVQDQPVFHAIESGPFHGDDAVVWFIKGDALAFVSGDHAEFDGGRREVAIELTGREFLSAVALFSH